MSRKKHTPICLQHNILCLYKAIYLFLRTNFNNKTNELGINTPTDKLINKSRRSEFKSAGTNHNQQINSIAKQQITIVVSLLIQFSPRQTLIKNIINIAIDNKKNITSRLSANFQSSIKQKVNTQNINVNINQNHQLFSHLFTVSMFKQLIKIKKYKTLLNLI